MTVVVLQDGSFEHLQWLCPKDTEVWKLRMLSSCLVFLCCLEMELLAELILFWNQSIKSIVYFAFLTLDKFHETLSINTLFQTRHGLKMIDHPRTHMIKWIHIYYIHGIWLVYIYIYMYTQSWNLFVLCFAWKEGCFFNQHKGHMGSRILYILYSYKML